MRMTPRVAAVRIEEFWDIPGLRVRCAARLTRPLSPGEARRLEDASGFRVSGNLVTYFCRPEESEEFAGRLAIELGRAAGTGPGAGPSWRRRPRGFPSNRL
jgi:hypothetical protein